MPLTHPSCLPFRTQALCTAALLAIAAPTAWAQSAETVITISAQRRDEELQKTPLAISVVNNIEMGQKQIRRLEDLKLEVPNVIIEANTGTSSAAKIFMRGVGTDESMFTADPSVAIYIDDVYIARQTGAMFDMFDLQRVEVLRGPQGTLYGRNATGGAVRYITKKPDGTPRLDIDARMGNYGRIDLQMAGSAKLGDSVAVSYGLMSKQREGYMQDITNNRTVGNERVNGARAGFAFNLGASTSARLSLDILRQRSGPAYASGVLDPARAAQFNRPVNNADNNLLTIETNLINGSNTLDQNGINFSTSTDLGAFEWRNIFSYRKMSNLLYIDLDGSAATRFHLYQDQSQNQKSYEAQFVSTAKGPLSWTGGVFLFKESNKQPTRQDIFATGGVNTVAQDTTASAIYGQADWRFNPVFKATAGLRTSKESKDFSIASLTAAGATNFNVAKSNTWTRTDWKLGIDAQFTPGMLAYASATTGFKSGGFNGRAGSLAAAQVVLKPETVNSYEIGLKASAAGMRFSANVFRNDYRDLQLTAFDANGVSNLTNAASATTQGVEMDAAAFITKEWQISANLGTLSASYKDFSTANAATFSGKQLKQAPKLQYGLSTGYRIKLADGNMQFNYQLKHVGDHYQNLANSEIIKTQAYTIADARMAYEAGNGMWSGGLWVKNMTNKLYYTGGFDIAGISIADAYINVPRTFGVDVRIKFW